MMKRAIYTLMVLVVLALVIGFLAGHFVFPKPQKAEIRYLPPSIPDTLLYYNLDRGYSSGSFVTFRNMQKGDLFIQYRKVEGGMTADTIVVPDGFIFEAIQFE